MGEFLTRAKAAFLVDNSSINDGLFTDHGSSKAYKHEIAYGAGGIAQQSRPAREQTFIESRGINTSRFVRDRSAASFDAARRFSSALGEKFARLSAGSRVPNRQETENSNNAWRYDRDMAGYSEDEYTDEEEAVRYRRRPDFSPPPADFSEDEYTDEEEAVRYRRRSDFSPPPSLSVPAPWKPPNQQRSPDHGRRVTSAPTIKTCNICLDGHPSTAFPTRPITSTCTHPTNDTCKDCLRQHLATQIANRGTATITCICHQLLSFEDVQHHANPADFARYSERAAINMVEQYSHFVWCPATGCSGGQIHEAGDAAPIVTCATCHRRFCYTHRVAWHTGITCRQYDALDPTEQIEVLERAEEEETARETRNFYHPHPPSPLIPPRRTTTTTTTTTHLPRFRQRPPSSFTTSPIFSSFAAGAQREAEAEAVAARQRRQRRQQQLAEERAGEAYVRNQSGAMACPGCRYMTEKIDGCKHMTCSKCRHQYCWTCRRAWVRGHLDVGC